MNAPVTTPAAGELSIDLDLSLVDGSTTSNPDKIRLIFRDTLIERIATAQAGLLAMGFSFAEVTIPLPDDLPMFEDDQPWIDEDRDASEGAFEASSTWLRIQPNCLHVEIWDEHGSDELHGTVNISDIPGLTEALLQAKQAAHNALIARLG